MRTILNFFRNLLTGSDSDMIGLAKIEAPKHERAEFKREDKKEYTLTQMLRRTY